MSTVSPWITVVLRDGRYHSATDRTTERYLDVWTAFVGMPGEGEVEEIDVVASSYEKAEAIAVEALARDYLPGATVTRLVNRAPFATRGVTVLY